jgi:predicted ATPase
MAEFIRSLTVKDFRSIPRQKVEFANPTFLVGVNGSGKSNFADVFAFISEAVSSPLQSAFDARGGISGVRRRNPQSHPPNIAIRIDFGRLDPIQGGHYAFEIKALPNYGFEVAREQCFVRSGGDLHFFDRGQKSGSPTFKSSVGSLAPSIEPHSLMLPLIGGHPAFSPVLKRLTAMRVYAIEPSRLREMQDPDGGMSLRADGGNAASVLQEIKRRSPEDVKSIVEMLAAIVPSTAAVRDVKHGNKVTLGFTQKWDDKSLNFEAFNMSDGTLRALGILLAAYQVPSPSLIVIEEPEATMHPGAFGAILDLLQEASQKMQVIVTTHSPDLLDAAKWIEERHLRIATWMEGATCITPLGDKSKKALQDHLMGAGELLRSNALQPPSDFFDTPPKRPHMPLFDEVPREAANNR